MALALPSSSPAAASATLSAKLCSSPCATWTRPRSITSATTPSTATSDIIHSTMTAPASSRGNARDRAQRRGAAII